MFNHTNSNTYLLIYIIVWVITLIVYQKKAKVFGAGSLLLVSYLLYSIASLVLFNNPYYRDSFNELKIFPFVYLYVMLLVASLPVLQYNKSNITEIQRPSDILFNIFIFVFIASSFVGLLDIRTNISKIISMFFDSAVGQTLYSEAMADGFDAGYAVSNVPAIISGSFSNLGILFFFYYLTKKKKNPLIAASLFVACIIGIISYLSTGQRGGVFIRLATFVITYFAFNRFLSKKLRRVVLWLGLLLITACILPIAALTSSRFNNTGNLNFDAKSSIVMYVGQENLFFNNYGLDNGGIRYGDRTIPLFKRMLGYKDVPRNFWDRRNKYTTLKIDDQAFYTFVGDFTIDYGPYIGGLIIVLFSIFAIKKTKIKDGRILFYQLILIHFVMCVCIQGGMSLFSFSDVAGNINIMMYVIAYVCFKVDYERQKIKPIELSKNIIA